MITEKLKKIVKEPKSAPATACVIWLHGLGANGNDFADIIPELGLPADHKIRFIFPHAPHQAVTINNGYHMPAWYDILGLSVHSQEDAQGIELAYHTLCDLIQNQHQEGIAYNHIFLIGFSQGGALALYTSLHFAHVLGGVAGLSTYLPLQHTISSSTTTAILPIFMAHGPRDPVVSLELGEKSLACLQKLGCTVEWHTYPILHNVSSQELTDLGQWIWKHL